MGLLVPGFRSVSAISLKTTASKSPRTSFLCRPRVTIYSTCIPFRHVTGVVEPKQELNSGNTYTQPAENLSQTVTPVEERMYNRTVEQHKENQARAPWLREGSDRPPVDRIGSKKSFAKGKLLTTPSRMLKLIIPLASRDEVKEDRADKELEPLALLVHPQQPLSYLERLLQSELPSIKDDHDNERIPGVWFRAPDAPEDRDYGGKTGPQGDKKEQDGSRDDKGSTEDKHDESKDATDLEASDVMMIDGKKVSTGKLKDKKAGTPVEQKESKKEVEIPQDQDDETAGFVRWSASTEIGDFIRDAAKGGSFALDIEGAQRPIMVAVPSFQERTYYLRTRLRQKSLDIGRLADIKWDCDALAERGAKTVAFAGGGALVAYWLVVYLLTFRTELGWDVMEPVTYLVGLSTLIGGYLWFLVHNRQVSYSSAMKFTISRRQSKLYDQKGFDLHRWEDLVQEGNRLRREIKMIAEEYDVTWNEKDDAKSEKVIQALKEERKKHGEGKKKGSEEDE